MTSARFQSTPRNESQRNSSESGPQCTILARARRFSCTNPGAPPVGPAEETQPYCGFMVTLRFRGQVAIRVVETAIFESGHIAGGILWGVEELFASIRMLIDADQDACCGAEDLADHLHLLVLLLDVRLADAGKIAPQGSAP